MKVILGNDVNEIYQLGYQYLLEDGVWEDSRAGRVLVAPNPVMSVYSNPHQRVLFDPVRDANPFFHLMEGLWMLAGRDDSEFLNNFVRDFGERFAEADGHLHGAYGARWFTHWSMNQISTCIEKLKVNQNDRRVVITMWDPETDLSSDARDIPCNTQIYPRIVGDELDITVMCRSNDIIWGAYGANAVHFSMLQEYMAGMIGCKIGKMYQLSNNFHAYENVVVKVSCPNNPEESKARDPYGWHPEISWSEMASDWSQFQFDLRLFLLNPELDAQYRNWDFFSGTARNMYISHALYKRGRREEALEWASRITSPDWRVACCAWIQRRIDKLAGAAGEVRAK